MDRVDPRVLGLVKNFKEVGPRVRLGNNRKRGARTLLKKSRKLMLRSKQRRYETIH